MSKLLEEIFNDMKTEKDAVNEVNKLNLSNLTVQKLRAEKIKVKVNHSRLVTVISNGTVKESIMPKYEIYALKKSGTSHIIHPRAGQTEVTVTVNGKDYYGKAVCSKDDNFCYRRAVSIALGRLTEVM